MHVSPALFFPPPPPSPLTTNRVYSSEPSNFSFCARSPAVRRRNSSPPAAYPSPPMSTDPSSPKYLGSPSERNEQWYQAQSARYGPQQFSIGRSDPSAASQVAARPPAGHEQTLPRPGFGPAYPQGRRSMLLTSEIDPSTYTAFSSSIGSTSQEEQFSSTAGQEAGSSVYESESALAQANAARKAKAHVPSACANCKKAHIRCDLERPCRRCVSRGTQDTCVDVQHKKRGRPRLREERSRDQRRDVIDPVIHKSRSPMRPPLMSSMSLPISEHLHGPGQYRVSKPRVGGPSIAARHIEHASAMDANIVSPEFGRRTAFAPEPAGSREQSTSSYALFNLDLTIIQCTQGFRNIIAGGMDVSGRTLVEFVAAADHDKVYHLQRLLRDERDVRDPAYLPPLYGGDDLRSIQRLSEADVVAAAHGFQLRSEILTIRLADGQPWRIPVHFQLARTNIFFGIVSLPPPPRPPAWERMPAPPTPYFSRDQAEYEAARQRAGSTLQPPPSYTQPGFRRFSSDSSIATAPHYPHFDPSGSSSVNPTPTLLPVVRQPPLEVPPRAERQYVSDPSLQLPPIRSSVTPGDSPEKLSTQSDQGSSRRPSAEQREAERRRDSMNIEGMLK